MGKTFVCIILKHVFGGELTDIRAEVYSLHSTRYQMLLGVHILAQRYIR